jgi:hypothetical protein
MLVEMIVVALVALLVVRSMVRSSERRVLEYCRVLAVRNFEALAAASKREPGDLLEAMEDAEDLEGEPMPELPQ